MSEVDQLPALQEGHWYAGGVTVCPVRIVRHHIQYGTHDPDDPPELSEDRPGECYYVRYRPPGAAADWRDGGVALSLREAVFLAERKLGPVVHWDR